MHLTRFADLGLPAAQLEHLSRLGFKTPSAVQQAALPAALQGKDLIVKAPTGSGKTLAFGLALLQRLDASMLSVQGLVLCPTRELAAQVASALRELASPAGGIKILQLTGGTALGPQVHSLSHGAHLVVGTPGRVKDLLERQALALSAVRTLVLDEADQMLEMGFYEDISRISLACPLKRQTLMFSATFSPRLLKETQGFLINPQHLDVQDPEQQPDVRQHFYKIAPTQRLQGAAALLHARRPRQALVFVNIIEQCGKAAAFLNQRRIQCLALHGELDQRQREDVMLQFRHHSCPVIIATDVAARGLDIKGLDLVLNLEISPNLETHLHRIGRTGRMNQPGLALNLVGSDEIFRAQRLTADGKEPVWSPLPPSRDHPRALAGSMRTICLNAGRKHKLRPGDILGALTKQLGLPAEAVGEITIHDFASFVAVRKDVAEHTLSKLQHTPVKGRQLKSRFL